MALPGLSFEIVRSSGPVLGLRADRTALIALTERGPVETPVLVHGFDQFVEQFGSPVDGMLGPLLAKAYFDNGGEELVVCRFSPVSDKPLAARLATTPFPPDSLIDRRLGIVKASNPDAKLSFTARDPGAFGNRLSVEAILTVRKRGKGTTTSAAVPLKVTLTSSASATFDESDRNLPVQVLESGEEGAWGTIAAVSGSPQEITLLGAISLHPPKAVVLEVYERTFTLKISEPGRADLLVPGLDLADLKALNERLAVSPVSLDVDPPIIGPELPLPGVRVQLSMGSDGLDPSGDGTALRQSFERVIQALQPSDLPDIVVAPDLWSRIFLTKGVHRLAFDTPTAIELGDAMVRSAALRKDRVVLLDPPLGPLDDPEGLRPLGVRELEVWRATREAELGADRDFVAAFTPWTRIVAGPVFKGDDTLLVPPSALVAGQMALTTRERGPWVATGNVPMEPVVGLDQTLSVEDEERLQDVGINPLRMSLPRGGTIQGVRSLSWPDRKAWRFLSTRRLFNFLRRALRPIGLSYVFESNSVATWIKLRRDLERLLGDMFAAGAFAGSVPAQAFVVKVDDELNPEEARQNGVLTAEIGVAPSVPLEFLVVRLVVANSTADVTQEPIVP
jgi:hypothetical protein